MKKTKNIFMAMAMACVAFCLTSCLNDDEPRNYLRGHFVIEGINPNYTLYSNDGFVVELSPSSVTSATSGSGFGNNKRGCFDISFETKDVKVITAGNGKKETHVSNATLMGGSFVTILSPMSWASCTDRNITTPDSIFTVDKFNDFWYHRGYLNLIITAPYSVKGNSVVFPTMNLAYKPEDVKENSIKFTLLYNRHTEKTGSVSAMQGSFVTAYSMHSLSDIVPGNDSISVSVVSDKLETQIVKVGR